MSLSLTNNEDLYDHVVKIVLIGDSSVGKTNILSRYNKNEFISDSNPTLGVAFATKLLISNNKRIRLQIWDTAGQEKYKSITNSYYINAKGALIVYDITKKSSYINLERWVNDIRELAGKDVNLIIVGNKSDLSESREVEFEEAVKKAKLLKADYIETSAKDNININQTFEELVNSVYNNYLINIENQLPDYNSDEAERDNYFALKKIKDKKNKKNEEKENSNSGCSC